jgi:surface antigen
MKKYIIAERVMLFKSRFAIKINSIAYYFSSRLRNINISRYRKHLFKHASVSVMAAMIVGGSVLDTNSSSDANLASYFPPPPDIATNIIDDISPYFTIDETDSLTIALKMSNLDEHDIIQNQPLIMVADSESSLGGAGIVYSVQKGDSYGKIAANYGLNVSSILAANNIDTAKIKKDSKALDLHEGQQINIPFENIDGPGWNDVLAAIQSAKDAAAAKIAKNKPKTTTRTSSKFLGSSGKRDYGTYSGFTAGWCTAYAAKVNPKVGNAVRDNGGGNAAQWPNAARAAGLKVNLVPEVGAIGVSSESRFGHVFRIDGVSGDTITISEYNGPAGRGVLGRREISKSMLKAVIH